MLAVILKSGKELIWHVGGKPYSPPEPNQVVEIQADGHELAKIVELFSHGHNVPTIPVPNYRPVVNWYGDLAKTIYAAIRQWSEW